MRDNQQTLVLELTSPLGRILTQLYGECGHRPIPVPVFSGLPAPSFSLAGDGGGGPLSPGPSPLVSAHLEGGPALHALQPRPGPAHRQPTEGTCPCLSSGTEGIVLG